MGCALLSPSPPCTVTGALKKGLTHVDGRKTHLAPGKKPVLSSPADSSWHHFPTVPQALSTVQKRVEVGSNPKLMSCQPGNPVAEPYLGVCFHHWLWPAEDCAACESLRPGFPRLWLPVAAALPPFVPALEAAWLLGSSLDSKVCFQLEYQAGWTQSAAVVSLARRRERGGVGGLGPNCLSWQQAGLCQNQLESCTLTDTCGKMNL